MVFLDFLFDLNLFISLIKSNFITETREVSLPNGLNALLIHNPLFTTSSIKITVEAGEAYTPDKKKGLAWLAAYEVLNCSPTTNEEARWCRYSSFNSGISPFLQICSQSVRYFWTLPDFLFDESVLWIATKLTNIEISNKNVGMDVNILREAYKIKLQSYKTAISDLFRVAMNINQPEQKVQNDFFDSLFSYCITKSLNSYLQDYYTANRIKVFLASSMSLDRLEQLIQLFSNIPPPKNTCVIPSLNSFDVTDQFTDLIGYDSKYAGKLGVYRLRLNTHELRISILLPGIAGFHKYKIIEYLKEVLVGDLRDPLKDNLIDNNLIKDLNVFVVKTQRVTQLNLSFTLPPTYSLYSIKEIIKKLYTWVISHAPDQEVMTFLNNKAIYDFREPVGSEEAIARYSYAFNLYRNFDLVILDTTYEFSIDILSQIFAFLRDTERWCALYSSDKVFNSFLNGELVCDLFISIVGSISDIVKEVQIDSSYSDIDRNNQIMNTYIVASQERRLTFEEFLQQSPEQLKIFHDRKEAGEITLLYNSNNMSGKCKVAITFLVGEKKLEIRNSELFFTIFKAKVISELSKEFKLEIEMNNIHHNGFNIELYGYANDIVNCSVMMTIKINNLEITEEDKTNAKKEIQTEITELMLQPITQLKTKLFHLFMGNSQLCDTSKDPFAKPSLPENIYTSVSAYGNITIEQLSEIFSNFSKFTDERLFPVYGKYEYELSFNHYNYSKHQTCNLMIVGYKVALTKEKPKPRVYQKKTGEAKMARMEHQEEQTENLALEYITGKFLKYILEVELIKWFTNAKTFKADSTVELVFTQNKIFLQVSVLSTECPNLLFNTLSRSLFPKWGTFISNLSDKELKDISDMVLYTIRTSKDLCDPMLGEQLYMRLFSVYREQLYETLKKEIYEMNREKLKAYLELTVYAGVPNCLVKTIGKPMFE